MAAVISAGPLLWLVAWAVVLAEVLCTDRSTDVCVGCRFSSMFYYVKFVKLLNTTRCILATGNWDPV